MKFCTYITMYSGDLLPKWYIGSSTIERIKKGNNTASKKYYVYNSIEDIYIDIKKGYLCDFCDENNIKYTTLYSTLITGKPINKNNRWGIPKGIGLQLFEGEICLD